MTLSVWSCTWFCVSFGSHFKFGWVIFIMTDCFQKILLIGFFAAILIWNSHDSRLQNSDRDLSRPSQYRVCFTQDVGTGTGSGLFQFTLLPFRFFCMIFFLVLEHIFISPPPSLKILVDFWWIFDIYNTKIGEIAGLLNINFICRPVFCY